MLSKFPGNTKLGGLADIPDVWAAIRRVLDRMEK